MFEVIAKIVFWGSIFGMGTVLIRYIPALKNIDAAQKRGADFFSESARALRKITYKAGKKFSDINFWEIWMQKIVSKIRVFALRIEVKCSHLLEDTRKRAKREKESKKYWDKMSKMTSKKDG